MASPGLPSIGGFLRSDPFQALTFDLQPAVHRRLPQHIDGLAGVDPRIEGAGFPDLQGADTLLREGAVFGITLDVHLVFHPDDPGLGKQGQRRAGKFVGQDEALEGHPQA